MTYDEKNAWAFLVIAIAGYTTYLAVLFGTAAGAPLTDVDYAPILLWTVGGAIVAGIVAGIVIGLAEPKGADKRDQRDREVKAFGDRVGQAFVIIGAVAALLLALVRADWFWIANVVYLMFVLSAVVGSIATLVAYRKGLPAW